MANIFNTAKYILEQLGPLSTMKLQKLCYYAQAWSLVWDDEPLFDEDFQAWKNGPVCYELFNIHRGQFKLSKEDIDTNLLSEPYLTDNQKDSINIVLSHYGGKNAQYLSQLSHSEDPWKEARHNLAPSENCETPITKESIARYYSGL